MQRIRTGYLTVMSQTPEPFDLQSYIPYRLAVAAERTSTALARRYRDEFGISVAEWRVLVHVSDAGAVSIRDIHQRVHLEKSKVSRAASRLEEAGYLIKEVNGQDRRLLALRLTDKGQDLMAQLLPIAQAFQTQLKQLLDSQLDAFDSALQILMEDDL